MYNDVPTTCFGRFLTGHQVGTQCQRNYIPTISIDILEVNADKTKYMIMSRDQNTGRSHSMKIDNSSIERVEEFKYLGITLTNKSSIQEEIKSRLKVGNACYYSV